MKDNKIAQIIERKKAGFKTEPQKLEKDKLIKEKKKKIQDSDNEILK